MQNRPFNDFLLFELSYLGKEEMLDAAKGRAELARRLEIGKRAIRKYTKPGDMIAFEAPDAWSFNDLRSLSAAGRLPVQQARKFWNSIAKYQANFYHNLAVFAERIGRRFVSLEPTIRTPSSNFRGLYLTSRRGTARGERASYLLERRADFSFMRKIEACKPQMAIVATSHAIFLEFSMRPKKAVYTTRFRRGERKEGFEIISSIHRAYNAEKSAGCKGQGQKESHRQEKTFKPSQKEFALSRLALASPLQVYFAVQP